MVSGVVRKQRRSAGVESFSIAQEVDIASELGKAPFGLGDFATLPMCGIQPRNDVRNEASDDAWNVCHVHPAKSPFNRMTKLLDKHSVYSQGNSRRDIDVHEPVTASDTLIQSSRIRLWLGTLRRLSSSTSAFLVSFAL